MKGKKLGLGLMGLLLVSSSAMADWATKVEDDAFSDSHNAMMIGAENEMNGVTFDCSSDELSVTYIEQADTKQVTEGIPADLVFKVDDNATLKFSGKTVIRNANYFGITVAESNDLPTLLAQIGKAKKRILVGIRSSLTDKKMSFTLSSSGSTSAVNKFVKACKIQLPADGANKG